MKHTPTRRRFLMLLSSTLLGLGTGLAHAGDIPWSSLSADEKRTLSRAQDKWDQLPTERQQRLLDGARRWQNMSPDQREQARERWEHRRADQHERRRERRD